MNKDNSFKGHHRTVNDSHSIIHSSKLAGTVQKRFRTETGGKLPHTAGNDLNRAVIGLIIMCTGFFLMRKWKATET
jgi:hypothetical protein